MRTVPTVLRAALAAVIVGGLVAITAAVRDSDDPAEVGTEEPVADVADEQDSGISDVAVTADDATVVDVVLDAAAPVEGSEVFVWGLAGPPVAHAWLTDGEWVAADGTVVEGDGAEVRFELPSSIGAVAVSTAGHRWPEVGYLEPSPAGGSEALLAGTVAEQVQTAVAEAQAGYGALDPHRRALVASLLARQLVDGTSVLRATDASGGAGTITVTVRYPTLVQTTVDATGRVVELRVGIDDVQSCVDAVCTAVATLDVPATAAAVVAVRPNEVLVEPTAPGSFDGEPTECASVETELPEGPTPGESCWLADGALASVARDDGFRAELVERRR